VKRVVKPPASAKGTSRHPYAQTIEVEDARSLIVIPTYSERDNLPRLVTALLEEAPSFEVLVVDDGSPDGTGEIAEAIARKTDRVHVLHRTSKQGLGTAYVAGFKYALSDDYEYVIQMDADFSHRPKDLPRLLQATRSADLAIGSRNVPGGRSENWSLPRRFISKGGSLYARTLLDLPIRDCTSGFKCFRREVLEALDLDSVESNGYGFQVEMNYLCHRAGFRITEVPIVFPDRAAGRSKMSRRIFLEAAALVWKLRYRESPLYSGAALPEEQPSATNTYARKTPNPTLWIRGA
jgi:dolichol-phosphate mannosyltransferase